MSTYKPRILVTGAESQLGKSLRMHPRLKNYDVTFKSRYTLDITDKKAVKNFFGEHCFDYCFNFGAYTNVNQAETNKKACFDVNVKGVANLAKAAKKNDVNLFHISTDYVFDGDKSKPYTEDDEPNPINVYGQSKLLGEEIIEDYLDKYLIIRTSWLYSKFNKNFPKTILELAKTQPKLKLVNDQIGTPTYAPDLIDFLLFMVDTIEDNPKKNYSGIYHFSNKGKASWYDFGKEILSVAGIDKKVKPIDTARFESHVKRPAYSVLSKNKIETVFDYKPRKWQEALQDFFN
jgi:dTDP-4-dehydrorhamnose reductase